MTVLLHKTEYEIGNSIRPINDQMISFTTDFCEDKEDGDYADPNNPEGYITCLRGIAYPKDCAADLVWNDDLKVCDWP